jgi:hypothetical protein
MVASMVRFGRVCVWRESGVRRLVLYWFSWQESGSSRREFFLHLIYFINTFYIFLLAERRGLVANTLLRIREVPGSNLSLHDHVS